MALAKIVNWADSSIGDTEDEICLSHLIQRCSEQGCDKVHSSMPYQWQKYDRGLRSGEWKNLPNNQEIERDYCNPAKTKHDGSPAVDFKTMTYKFFKVRRISSQAVTPGDALSCLSTRWQWYWEEEGTWNTYRSQGDGSQSLYITTEKLEECFLRGETTIAFTAGPRQYDLSFSDMLQTNCHTKFQRLVRRRPVILSEEYVRKTCEMYSGIPTDWDLNLLPSVGYKRIKLGMSSPEYSTVLELFNETMQGPGLNILSIERIQNLQLWNFFKLQRDAMNTKAGKEVDEKLLFHGTETQHVDAICKDNIDWRMCGKNGVLYGEGSYFARDAKYSNGYASDQGMKSMFVCRVLVGDFTTGKKNDRKPPFKDEQNGVAFHSCVNNMNDPSIFVIFEKSQIYPEYLIQYREPVQPPQVIQPSRAAQPSQAAQPPQAPQASNSSDCLFICGRISLCIFCCPCVLIKLCRDA